MGKIIEIKVIPKSRVEEVVDGEPMVVRVKEPPEMGRANRAVIKLLSKHFNARVRILSGGKGRKKVVEIES